MCEYVHACPVAMDTHAHITSTVHEQCTSVVGTRTSHFKCCPHTVLCLAALRVPVVLCAHVLCVPAHTQCRACASPHFRELGANTASSMAPLSACKGRGGGGEEGGRGGGREGGREGGNE